MNGRRFFAVIALSVLAINAARAADYIWLIGGGPSLDDSQGQIEENVKWEREVLLRHARDAKFKIFYTDGDGPAKDVIVWRHPDETAAALQPLARVFGMQTQNGESFHSHTVPGVAGGTRADDLVARLKKEFTLPVRGDRVSLIFYGHGTYDGNDVGRNALRLWGNTLLPARDLESLLSVIDPEVPVRFILPQCFSGGFTRLMHPRGDATRELVRHNRCGFMSVPEDQLSEGCSPSIDVGDFRDYSTYFFAALDGRTRLGEKFSQEKADLDGDGVVTLREAHLYSIATAVSTDSPRSTSEVFLEDWQPWYLRWITYGPEPDNVYQRLAAQVAAANGLPPSGRPLIEALEQARRQTYDERHAMKLERNEIKSSVKQLQETLRADLIANWPEAGAPYTLKYKIFLQNQLGPAQAYIMQHAAYAPLVKQQERMLQLDTSILAAERRLAQFDKILRLRKLARLLDQFQRVAGREDRESYRRLLSCEESRI
jgi:hypothetical protein